MEIQVGFISLAICVNAIFAFEFYAVYRYLGAYYTRLPMRFQMEIPLEISEETLAPGQGRTETTAWRYLPAQNGIAFRRLTSLGRRSYCCGWLQLEPDRRTVREVRWAPFPVLLWPPMLAMPALLFSLVGGAPIAFALQGSAFMALIFGLALLVSRYQIRDVALPELELALMDTSGRSTADVFE